MFYLTTHSTHFIYGYMASGNKTRSDFSQTAVLIKISNLLICLCSFDLSCPILKKDDFKENLYTVLS